MKAKIHPKYYDVVATCACGETFKTRSTTPELRLEICSKCHPFFTGKQKLVDSAGRVERFQKRYRNSPAVKAAGRSGKSARRPPAAEPTDEKAPAPADSVRS